MSGAKRPLPQSSKAPAFYNNPNVRAVFYQVLLVATLGYFFFLIVANTLANMKPEASKPALIF